MSQSTTKEIMISLLCICLLYYFWLGSRIDSVNFIHQNIFILAGQSNMAGRGGVSKNAWDGIVPLECRPSPAIFRLSAGLKWEEAHESLHTDIDANKTCGVGPGMAFANAVLERDSRIGAVGLVPCAVGGTRISEWSRGSWLYSELVRRARAAEGGGEIRAVLWYQGERDTVSIEDAESYKGKLEKLILDLRYDLQSPVLPVFQVALASGQGPFLETVREAQLSIDLPNVISVDAKELLLEPDGLHLTTQAQVCLGEMLAQAFLQKHSGPIYNNAPSRSSSIGPLIRSLLVILILDQSFIMQIKKLF